MLASIPKGFYIGNLEIRFYGIIMGISIVLAILFAYKNMPKRGLKSDDIIDLALWAVPLGIIGARVFYVLFSGYEYTFIEALKIWEGGLSIIGAVTFGAVGVGIGCLVKKINFLKVADCVVPGLLFAQALGRWGNFFNQEAYGPVVDFNFFPISTYIEATGSYHAATFFYESAWNIIGFVVLMLLLRKQNPKIKSGMVMCLYFMWYGFGRFFIEMLRQDPLVVFGSLRFSQLMAGLMFVGGLVGVITIYLIGKKADKKNV